MNKEKGYVRGYMSVYVLPSILEPNFDLFRFYVRENRTFPYQLLAAHRAWLRTVMVEPFKCFYLFWCVPNVLSVVHCYFAPSILAD